MSGLLAQSLNAGLDSTAALTQSTQTIGQYVSWVESTPSDVAGDQSGTVDAIKSHALDWYNAIYPQYLNMPGFLAGKSDVIDTDLTLLVALAEQYSPDGNTARDLKNADALDAQIRQSAANLVETVNEVTQQANTLSQALQTFGQNVTADGNSISDAIGNLQKEVEDADNTLVGAYGQRNSLESAACPDSDAISACNDLINSTQATLARLEKGVAVVGGFGIQINSVVSAARYLASYWTSVATDAGTCLQNLQLLTTTPSAITKIDLKGAQQRWDALVQHYENTCQQLARP